VDLDVLGRGVLGGPVSPLHTISPVHWGSDRDRAAPPPPHVFLRHKRTYTHGVTYLLP
jgi:hypothetical protein